MCTASDDICILYTYNISHTLPFLAVGNVYCDKHRIATAHDCVFDWKGTGRAKIEKDLEKNKEKKSGGRSFQRLDSSH